MSNLPASVASLDLGVVTEVLVRHECNVSDASQDLGVPASDLRRLLWSNAKLQDEVYEVIEARLDAAEKNIHEALHSADSRRRDAASFFVLRNTHKARRRGWITTSSSAAELSLSVEPSGAHTVVYRWRSDDDDKAEAERAETERLLEEGKQVVSIGWADSDKPAIEGEASSPAKD
jgi:hypothetical protein